MRPLNKTLSYEEYLKEFNINYPCKSYDEFFAIISNHYNNGKEIPEGAAYEELTHSILNSCRLTPGCKNSYYNFYAVKIDEDLFLLPPSYKITITMTTGEKRILYNSSCAFISGTLTDLNIREDLIENILIENKLTFMF